MPESRKAEAACSGTSKCSSLGKALNETEKVNWATAVKEPERQGEVHALSCRCWGATEYSKRGHYLMEVTG